MSTAADIDATNRQTSHLDFSTSLISSATERQVENSRTCSLQIVWPDNEQWVSEIHSLVITEHDSRDLAASPSYVQRLGLWKFLQKIQSDSMPLTPVGRCKVRGYIDLQVQGDCLEERRQMRLWVCEQGCEGREAIYAGKNFIERPLNSAPRLVHTNIYTLSREAADVSERPEPNVLSSYTGGMPLLGRGASSDHYAAALANGADVSESQSYASSWGPLESSAVQLNQDRSWARYNNDLSYSLPPFMTYSDGYNNQRAHIPLEDSSISMNPNVTSLPLRVPRPTNYVQQDLPPNSRVFPEVYDNGGLASEQNSAYSSTLNLRNISALSSSSLPIPGQLYYGLPLAPQTQEAASWPRRGSDTVTVDPQLIESPQTYSNSQHQQQQQADRASGWQERNGYARNDSWTQ